jgi:hypothetical protein
MSRASKCKDFGKANYPRRTLTKPLAPAGQGKVFLRHDAARRSVLRDVIEERSLSRPK